MSPDSLRLWKNIATHALVALSAALAFVPGGRAAATSYAVTNLVSDQPGMAVTTDANLVNPWGIAFNPAGFVWVANNGTGTSTLYDGKGAKNALTVNVPLGGGGNPTGIVFNGSSGFTVTNGTTTGPSRFIFATESGMIAGWAPTVNGTNALVANTSTNGAIYKGLALGPSGPSQLLYATDFHNATVSVFNQNFQPTTVAGGFVDPNLPTGYAPFGIQNINGNLYVTYAKQGSGGDEQDGAGLGLVDKFDANGNLLSRVTSNGPLNAPWGLALAPANFGPFSNALLVGNFGDGSINAFNATTGSFLGMLRDANGKALMLDGLWGMSFGNGLLNQPTNTLFFAAGIGDESHGLYGRIDAVPEPSAALLALVGLLGLAIGHRRLRSHL
jgi:uncharacterized protein (TIGR03118 family)